MTKDDITSVYLENKDKYLNYIKAKVDNYELSEDILHNSFLNILSLEKKRMDEIDNASLYIRTIINNNIIDFYRSGYNNNQIPFSSTFSDSIYNANVSDIIDIYYFNMGKYHTLEYTNDIMLVLEKCINELDYDQRMVFIEYYILDCNIDTIAGSHNIKYETASSRIYYAKKKVIKRLNKYLGSELKNFLSAKEFKTVI